MISKDAFIKIMDGLRDYWDELGKDMDRLGVVFEDNYLTKVFDNTMDALCGDLEADLESGDDNTPWCYYFAFELNWGRDKNAIDCVTIGNSKFSLQTAEQLYDFLMLLNNEE